MNLTHIQAGLAQLELPDLAMLAWRMGWLDTSRPEQLAPEGEWTAWLILSGRGWGKTRTGAEDIAWFAVKHPQVRCGVIAPTSSDIRGVCFEGESGLMAVLPPQLVASYNKSLSEILLTNGSIIRGFSAEEPSRLRGPQFHRVWLDELAAWQRAQETFDMIKFCLRLGDHPQMVVTTTPRPIELIVDLVDQAQTGNGSVMLTTGSSYDNAANLAPSFIQELASYEGTALGAQEIYGEVLDLESAGIIKRDWFRLWPAARELPTFVYIVQSYDTAYTERTTGDPSACTVWGVFRPLDRPLCVMLIDCWADHLAYPDLKPKLIEEFESIYGGETDKDGRRTDLILIEEKASGQSLVQDLGRAGLPVQGYNPGRLDKVQRAHLVSNIIAAGRVYVPESTKRPGYIRDWAEPFMRQVCSFPEAAHDDYVDTMTQALRILRDMNFLNIDPEPVDDDYYEEDRQRARQNPYAM